MFIYPK